MTIHGDALVKMAGAKPPPVGYNRTMDDELKELLIEYLRSQQKDRSRDNDITVLGAIDWAEIASVAGYAAGGPLIGKLLKKFFPG